MIEKCYYIIRKYHNIYIESRLNIIKNKKGFTLIELIVVVAIIGILVAVLVPSISGQFDNAKEMDTATSATDLQTVKEINKHMKLYLGDNSKLTTDKGGYQLAGGVTPPPQPPVEAQDSADPTNVTMAVKTTGKNATGTFAGREYILGVKGLTKDAKYKVTVGGVTKGIFKATGATQKVDLKGAFAPTVPATTATHTAQVGVTALNPATGVTAEKGSVSHNLTFYDGNGSTRAPYLICDPESLQMLSHKVNNDNVNFGNKNYKQIVSVDMTPVANFPPIGNTQGGDPL